MLGIHHMEGVLMILPSDQEPASKSVSSHKAPRRPPIASLARRTATRADLAHKAVDLRSCPAPAGAPEAPLAVSAALDPRAVISNLPLADAVLSLCSCALSPAALDH